MNSFSYSESLRFERLSDTFTDNFKITRLYALYLENYPEAITEKMIADICSDSDVEPADAIAVLLGMMFGLDTDNNQADRVLMRNYIIPSINVLDTEKYENNPYYKNIKLPSVKKGSWEFRRECYEPYRAVIYSDMIIKEDFTEIPPLAFFKKRFEFPAVLEDGNEWMTLTPVDLDTCEEAIADAHGKVVTFGLGLGYYAYMVSEKPDVESITVVERSRDVIELFKQYVLPQFPNKDKVRITEADAFEYAEHTMPYEKYDYAFVDTWRDASDGAPMYRKMKALEHLSPSTRFSYWIESFLISRLRAERFAELSDMKEKGELKLSYADVIESLRNPLSPI